MLPYHSALRAFILTAAHYKRPYPQELLNSGNEADPESTILKLLGSVDLEARAIRNSDVRSLTRLGGSFPVLARRATGHWIVIVDITGDPSAGYRAFVVDIENEAAGIQQVPFATLAENWGSVLILCAPRKRTRTVEKKFGFGWFFTEIFKYKRYFRDIAIASFVLSILGLITPLLFNIIVDKIIPHRTYQTLYVVAFVAALTALFEGLFGYLIQNLTLSTTNKVDATLSAKMFSKLLSLPMDFFEKIPAGVIFRNLQQTDRVRHFLTGSLFQTLLQAATLPVLIVLLISYSWKLTLVVTVFTISIAAIIGIMIPMFRARLNELFAAEGARQALSIETIHGIRTVKSLCLEQAKQESWESKVVASVRKSAQVGHFGIVATTLTGFLEKTMLMTILCVGAVEVFNGNLTLGALIAFNMLSSRVSGPLLQMVKLINEYQETALSVQMLATVMNHPPERDPQFRGSKPPVVGRLDFEGVSFRYPGAAVSALEKLTFTVLPGRVIGVVGRSGSGKTTLTRLMQGIQIPSEGIIKLDGVDLRQIDLTHLRQNVGVVLQDSFLFRGTIAENIAASNPGATTQEIIAAARLAGAEEFIDQLPMAYESFLEEGATNLSGGQRQRIAIARALLPQPKFLIFDEATSALDPESESIIQRNLSQIARGRSMIIVSHRLSSLVHSDAILVLNRGRIVDFAPHADLLERCEIYSHLWQQQTKAITELSGSFSGLH
ncbi:MAG: ATP-binding cassette, subfamily bacterial HlyB/CyaB [Chthoniobacter sp.]|nr:ATP-binding cassette, subfamily bacterial HlyB/CyaB [Chthoniobacter sp.]